MKIISVKKGGKRFDVPVDDFVALSKAWTQEAREAALEARRAGSKQKTESVSESMKRRNFPKWMIRRQIKRERFATHPLLTAKS